MTRLVDLTKAVLTMMAIGLQGCGGNPPPPMSVAGPSSFTVQKIVDAEHWSCIGLVDLDADDQLELVLFRHDEMRIVDPLAPARMKASYLLDDYQGGDLGCTATDLDGDGKTDLVVVGARTGVALMNKGKLRFETVSLPLFPEAGGSIPFAVAPIPAAAGGLPDLYVVRNMVANGELFVADGCAVGKDGEFLCGIPGKLYPGRPNLVLHNLNGTAWEIEDSTGAEDPRQNQAVAVVDVDGDGLQDLVVADDASTNRIFRNRGSRKFEDVTVEWGLTMSNHGMGVAAGDLDGDGRLDFAFSEIGRPLVVLGSPHGFRQLGADRGFGKSAGWAWGVAMEDFDNDGDLDILYEGVVPTPAVWKTMCSNCGMEKLPRRELVLYRNDGARNDGAGIHFTTEEPAPLPTNDPAPDAQRVGGGTALAVADIDHDGVLDAVVLRQAASDPDLADAWLLRGTLTTDHHSLAVAAPQGARVTACVNSDCQSREVLGADSYRAFRPAEVHFGLGSAPSAEVSVEFPHGHIVKLGSRNAGFFNFKP